MSADKNTLKALRELGQSPWYDNIERRLIKTGTLKRLFDLGLLGVTSNPSIFQKAIEGAEDYDEQIMQLSGESSSIMEIYDALTMKDITDAAGLLRDIYHASGGIDGLVSIEVPPQYAYDAQKTIDAAGHIYRKINKENILIKIPGTDCSDNALRKLVSDGININVTLLFSIAHYRKQAKAYTEGLKDALAKGKDISKIRSVASVFVSRVDTKVDALLDKIAPQADYKGKAAVANCKIIYQEFKKIFYGMEFMELRNKGARIQRIVWASTSTKNPAYSDIKYVEELVGPDTVNTMPQATIEAYLKHGRPSLRLEEDLDTAENTLSQLESLGIYIDDVCNETQTEGVKAFQDSFDSLIASIKLKIRC
ncbi:MAG: transaldolase [Candidatus Omnitrophota bacterium]